MHLIARLLKWVQLPWTKVKGAIDTWTCYHYLHSSFLLTGDQFPWRTHWRILLFRTRVFFFFRFDCCQICRTGGEVVGVFGASKKWRRCSILASTCRQRPVLFVHACVSLFSLPTCGAREFTLRSDILASCMPVTRKTRGGGKKWDSPPVTGTTTWRTEAAKIPETKKKKRNLWPDMSKKLKASCLARARVSRYHRVLMSSSRTLWGNIFPPAFPKQSE